MASLRYQGTVVSLTPPAPTVSNARDPVPEFLDTRVRSEGPLSGIGEVVSRWMAPTATLTAPAKRPPRIAGGRNAQPFDHRRGKEAPMRDSDKRKKSDRTGFKINRRTPVEGRRGGRRRGGGRLAHDFLAHGARRRHATGAVLAGL